MERHGKVPGATLDRLPLYYRILRIAWDEGLAVISSDELAWRMELTPEQVRKDLSAFGQFGKRGVGYYIDTLRSSIGEILGLEDHLAMAIIGMGSLGQTLAEQGDFRELGFRLTALFDRDPDKIGTEIGGLVVEDAEGLEATVKDRGIKIGVITLPARAAQGVANMLIMAGVKGIWNFAPVMLQVPENVHVINEDISSGILKLSLIMKSESS